jgi:hypothetical protein
MADTAVTYVAASLPGAPGLPAMTSRTATEISIQWPSALENGSIVYRYDVYEAANIDLAFELVGSSPSADFVSTGLTPGNNYRYKVKAVNYAGIGPFSVESEFIIAAVVPDAPINLIRLYADNSFITIGWETPLYNGGTPEFGYKILWDAG